MYSLSILDAVVYFDEHKVLDGKSNGNTWLSNGNTWLSNGNTWLSEVTESLYSKSQRYTLHRSDSFSLEAAEWVYNIEGFVTGSKDLFEKIRLNCVLELTESCIIDSKACTIDLGNGKVIDVKQSIDTLKMIYGNSTHYTKLSDSNGIVFMGREIELVYTVPIVFIFMSISNEQLDKLGVSSTYVCDELINSIRTYRQARIWDIYV